MSRPGHFRGVATVVLKLLSIVQPDRAYFGQKDAQQARLLLRMVDDLNVPTRLVICPIVREADGLAMSSRNRYLSAEQRAGAGVLFRTLEILRERIDAGERRSAPLLDEARRLIESTPGADVEYVEIASWRTLESVDVLNGEILIALAVRFGSTRLIDNLRLRIDDADQRG
jgi:pantoate--beta-alanine ligase